MCFILYNYIMSNEQPIQAETGEEIQIMLNGWSKIVVIVSVVKLADSPRTVIGILFSFDIGYLPPIRIYRHNPRLGTLLQEFIQAVLSRQE